MNNMSKIKIFSGMCLCIQAFAFLVLLFLSGASIKKKALVCGMLATGMGAVGVYLFLKGAKDYTPAVKCCCGDTSEDYGFEMEEADDAEDISFNILDGDDIIEDIAE